MTNQEILEKAIQKAIDGGWIVDSDKTLQLAFADAQDAMVGNHEHSPYYYHIIFSHDFAKALWGEEPHYIHGGYFSEKDWHPDNVPMPVSYSHWQYHLQNMVIAEDPIKYLGESI